MDQFRLSKLNPLQLALIVNLLVLVSHLCRPLIPIDETRYLTVAWEMFSNSNYLVPTLNQEVYAHKPILLFWLVNLIWKFFGLSETAVRLTIDLFSLGNILITFYLAKLIYPTNDSPSQWAPLVLSSFPLWNVLCGTLMFDTMMCFFGLLQLLCMLLFCQKNTFFYAMLAGLFGGLGLLTKGPVLLVYTLPVLCFYPLWIDEAHHKVTYGRWYFGLTLSLAFSFLLLFSWALPAAHAGGEIYAKQLLWHQTVDRISGELAHAHKRPFYWYLQFIPLSIIPISLTKSFWQFQPCKEPRNQANLFCILWLVLPFLTLSFIGGKHVHYLLPLLPPLAILFSSNPQWIQPNKRMLLILVLLTTFLCFASPLLIKRLSHERISYSLLPMYGGCLPLFFSISLLFFMKKETQTKLYFLVIPSCLITLLVVNQTFFYSYFDVSPTARVLADLRRQKQLIAVWSEYFGEYGFYARLRKKVVVTNSLKWLDEHPNAIIIFRSEKDIQKLAMMKLMSRNKETYFISSEKLRKVLAPQT